MGAETVIQAKKKHKPADADTVVQVKQKRKPVGAATVIQGKKKHKPAGAHTVVQVKQKRKPAGKIKTKRSVVVLPDSVLKKRRLKAKLKKRKQRQKIRENPEALKLQQAQEKARRQRRKENGSIKPIAELRPREQRRLRKQWRINTKRYREKKKALADAAAQSEGTETLPSKKSAWVEEISGDRMQQCIADLKKLR